jgi:hypothetical protein
MMLSVRNVSRFGLWPVMVGWMAVSLILIVMFGALLGLWIHDDRAAVWPIFVFGGIVWLGGGNLLQVVLFRCPRCHGSSLYSYGRLASGVPYSFSAPPFWTPRTCSRCGLDFTARAYWARDNKDMHDLWVAEGHDTKPARL